MANKADKKQMVQISSKTVLAVFSVSVVFGLSWVFGAFIVEEVAPVFRYLFVICNVFQGFFFSFFTVIIGSDGREFWLNLLKLKKKSKKVFGRSRVKSFDQTVTKSSNLLTTVNMSKIHTLASDSKLLEAQNEVNDVVEEQNPLNDVLEVQNPLNDLGNSLEMGFANVDFKENSTEDANDLDAEKTESVI